MTDYRVENEDGVQALDYNNLLYLLGGKGIIEGCEVTASEHTLGVDVSEGRALRNGEVIDVAEQTVYVDPGESELHRRDLVGVDENGDAFVRSGTPDEYHPDITDSEGNVDLDRVFETHAPAVRSQDGRVPLADIAVPAETQDIDGRHIRNRSLTSLVELFSAWVKELSADEAEIDDLRGNTRFEALSNDTTQGEFYLNREIATLSGTAPSYVILLEQFDSTVDDYTRGTFFGKREAGSTGVMDRMQVDTTSTSAGSHRGSLITTRMVNWSDSFIELATCEYEGTEYVALNYDTSDSNITHGTVYFTGESNSTAPEHLTLIPYKGSSGVLNEEINDSLTPVGERDGFRTSDTVDFQTSNLRHNGEAISGGGGGGSTGGSGGLTYSEGQMTLPSGDHRDLGMPISVPSGSAIEVYQVAVTDHSSLELQLYNTDSGSTVASYTAEYQRGSPIDTHSVGGDTVVPRLAYTGSGIAEGVSGMMQFDVVEED